MEECSEIVCNTEKNRNELNFFSKSNVIILFLMSLAILCIIGLFGLFKGYHYLSFYVRENIFYFSFIAVSICLLIVMCISLFLKNNILKRLLIIIQIIIIVFSPFLYIHNQWDENKGIFNKSPILSRTTNVSNYLKFDFSNTKINYLTIFPDKSYVSFFQEYNYIYKSSLDTEYYIELTARYDNTHYNEEKMRLNDFETQKTIINGNETEIIINQSGLENYLEFSVNNHHSSTRYIYNDAALSIKYLIVYWFRQ